MLAKRANKIIAGFFAVICLSFCGALLPINDSVHAAVGKCEANSNFLTFPNWYRGLNCETDKGYVVLDGEDIGNVVFTVLLNVVDILLIAAGIVCAGMIIFSGAKYMTARGNLDNQAVARKAMSQAVIGLAIAVLASPVVGFVVSRLSGGAAISGLTVQDIVDNGLTLIYWLLGVMAAAMIIFGSYQLLTSKGFPDRALTARHTILGAVIGLALVLLAAFVTNVVMGILK